jgi:2-polyprenyl-3-methyl-5-hydroxy-6-metoxy-1,4-benzoquinol methylase
MSENTIQSLLISLGICSHDSIQEFYPRVRDRNDIRVMRCDRSGVLFLSRSDHVTESHYANQSDLSYWSANDRTQAVRDCFEDDSRRAKQFGSLIRGRRWLDVGTGVGGILDLLANQASEAMAVEAQTAARQELIQCGYQTYANIEQVQDDHFDVVTLFHVFEHLTAPLTALRTIAGKMTADGCVIIEVPHANDFLLSFLDLEAFKRFTFWSEHLILHTRKSLEIFLRHSGFTDIQVTGYQRYPLANHLYWLAKGQPSGHKEWSVLLSDELDSAYQTKLSELDRTDTLIAVARK